MRTCVVRNLMALLSTAIRTDTLFHICIHGFAQTAVTPGATSVLRKAIRIEYTQSSMLIFLGHEWGDLSMIFTSDEVTDTKTHISAV